MTTDPDALSAAQLEVRKWQSYHASAAALLDDVRAALGYERHGTTDPSGAPTPSDDALPGLVKDALSAAQRSDQRLRELWQAMRQTQGQIVPVLNDEMIPLSLALQWADQLSALLSEKKPVVTTEPDGLESRVMQITAALGRSPHSTLGWEAFELIHELADALAAAQRLRDYVQHKNGCPLVPRQDGAKLIAVITYDLQVETETVTYNRDVTRCTCGLADLLKKSLL